MTCAVCRHDNPPGAKFCNECGRALAGAPAAPAAARFTSPEAYTPRHLAEKILVSRSALEGERKQVTVLFCDLAGSTGLAERLGPEGMHATLDAFFDLAVAEVHRYEGTINQFLGDGFMALFGAPLAHEDHARRAVLAALAIQRRLPERGGAAAALAVRIGINTGPVVVGKIGDNLRMDYTAIGDTTNLAARLQQAAAPGTIYLGESTQRAVEPHVELEALGARALKGKAEPVTVFRALGPRARSRPPAPSRALSSPLVGRDAEVAALLACVERVSAGRGGIVSVSGEAGVGKSRLLAAVRERAAPLEVRWLEGRGLSFGRTLGYWPFLEILRTDAGIAEDDREGERWARLERRISSLFGEETGDVLPYVAAWLGLHVPGDLEHRVRHLDAQALKCQILLTSRRLVERLARERALVLVFEDAHWIDPSSAELLEHLLPLVETAPLLICAVGRPHGAGAPARLPEIAAARHPGRHLDLRLAPLSPSDSARLAQNLLRASALPARVSEAILSRAEGNPFFVEEVIRALIDVGALVRSGPEGGWELAPEAHQPAIPDTVQGVIMARVDRLDDDLKSVLKLASVIGRTFFYRVLRAITGDGGDPDRPLGQLQELELIRERRRLPELEYAFKHALVQEATYDTILSDRRRRLHREVARCLEALFAGRLEEFFGLLAYHYSRAEEWEKAQEYLFKAGDRAGQVAADAEALAHYQQALEAHARAFGDRWDPVQRAVVERKMGEALFRRGDHHRATEYLQSALARLGAPYPASRWSVRLAIARELGRQAVHRLLPRRVWAGRAAPSGVTAQERARIYELRVWIDYFVDRERTVLDTLLLLNFCERAGLAPGVAHGFAGVGAICDLVPLPWLAGRYHRRAVALAEEIRQPVPLAIAYFCLGFHEQLCVGEPARALEHHRRAARAFREAGELRGWGGPTTMSAVLLLHRGDLAESLALSQELIRIGRDGADRHVWGWGLLARGWALLTAGALDDAIAALRQALELFETIPDHGSVAEARGFLGQCYLRQGRLEQAVAELEGSARFIAARGLQGHQVSSTRIGLAEARLVAAEQAAGAERGAALGQAKRACRSVLAQRTTVRPSAPHAYRLRGTYEWLRGRPAAAGAWWRRSLADATALGARYDLGLTHLEIGRRLGERSHLERAEALLGEIGATLDLARARALLGRGAA